MKVVRLLLVLVVAGGFVLGTIRFREARDLRDRNESLRPTVGEVQRLGDENARLAGLSLDEDELKRLRQERSELMKLRSEVGELRRIARATVPELKTQIQTARAQAETEQKAGDLIQARHDAWKLSKKIRGALSELFSLAHELARVNDKRLPDSFEQMEAIAAGLPEKHVLRTAVASVLNSTNRPDVGPRSFEFLRQDRPVAMREKSVLLLRERAPRPSPDGGWFRAYAFADGRIEEAFSPEGKFEDWERQQASGKPGSAVLGKD